MECPECKTNLGEAWECKCGWKAAAPQVPQHAGPNAPAGLVAAGVPSEQLPVTRLVDPLRAQQMMNAIVGEYESVQNEFPFVFVIGHASQIDDPLALDKSESARMERNWEYAGRRAGLIARLVQEHLTPDQKGRIVVVSAGEMDMRAPQQPDSPDNAWAALSDFSKSSAAIVDEYGKLMPNASIAEDIVLAVYIPPHDPAPGHACRSTSSNSISVIFLALKLPTAPKELTTVRSCPSYRPALIVPP